MVVNFDMPNTIEDYIHRIGRTGRAGAKGISISFFTEKSSRMAADLKKILVEAKQDVPPGLDQFSRSGGGGGGSYRDRGYSNPQGTGGSRGFGGGGGGYPAYPVSAAPPQQWGGGSGGSGRW